MTVNTYFPQVVNNVFLPVTIQGSASDYPDASAGEQFVQQVITAAQNMSELSFPSKLDSMRGDGYIDNLTIIVQVDENNTSGASVSYTHLVYVPKVDEHFMASLAVIPLQLLGYYVSVAKGLDVDKPRNLAKSVTVE